MRNFFYQSLLGLTLLSCSGCILLTPQKVKWWWADWNSERQLNAQVEMFDHLPLTPLRVRLMRWGYNIGESAYSLPISAGMESGTWTQPMNPEHGMGGPSGMSPESIPQLPGTVPSLEAPLEIVPPPAPPAERELPTGEQGPQGNPTADLTSPITRASYRISAANSAWMFSNRSRAARSSPR